MTDYMLGLQRLEEWFKVKDSKSPSEELMVFANLKTALVESLDDERKLAGLIGPVEKTERRRILDQLNRLALEHCGVAFDVAVLPSGYFNAAMPPTLFMVGETSSTKAGAKGLEALAQGRGRAVLSASTGEQSSYIRKDRKMSIFTYHLIEALTGHAQPQEGAKEVLVSDVMSYVTRKVPPSAQADCSEEQTPDYQVSGNFPVALLLGGKGLSKGKPAPEPGNFETPLKQPGKTTVFDQRGQTVGTQTNIAGNVTGPVLSGQFDGPVALGGGEAVDMRGSQGAVYKPSGPVKQHFGDRVTITGDGNVIGNNNRVNVNKSQTTGVTVDAFLRLLGELREAIPQAGLDPDEVASAVADLDVVEQQARKPQPKPAFILAKLNGILSLLATADGVWGLADRVRPLAEQAVNWAGQLFR